VEAVGGLAVGDLIGQFLVGGEKVVDAEPASEARALSKLAAKMKAGTGRRRRSRR
jgi:hypothetical protein